MISLEIAGDPIPQKRPRFSRQGGHVHAYDPSKGEKEQAQWQMKSQFREDPLLVPMALDLLFFMPVPKSTSKLKAKQMVNGLLAHTKKPDIDNLVKFVLDAMNGLIFKDDSQIIELRCKKMYSSNPGTTIRVIPLASEKRELLYENCSRDF